MTEDVAVHHEEEGFNYSFGRFVSALFIFKISGTFLEQVVRWHALEHPVPPHHPKNFASN
jgi:hypothetical protein